MDIISLLIIGSMQLNPCQSNIQTVNYNPTKLYVELDPNEFSANIPGSTNPMWTEILVGNFLQGVNPTTGGQPISTSVLPKSSLALVLGTTNCYQADLVFSATANPTVLHYSSARVRRIQPDNAESNWSPLSNPFVRLAAPLSPGAVRRIQ